jgi:hypothetical protein
MLRAYLRLHRQSEPRALEISVKHSHTCNVFKYNRESRTPKFRPCKQAVSDAWRGARFEFISIESFVWIPQNCGVIAPVLGQFHNSNRDVRTNENQCR